jgi:hypothetical protein
MESNRMLHKTLRGRAVAVAVPVALASLAAVAYAGDGHDGTKTGRDRQQDTMLISRSYTGGVPNGASTNAVISNDRRYARVIAYQSNASNIVRGDTNAQTDVFAVVRRGPVNNRGTKWRARRTVLVSRGRGGPADGASFAPAVSGGFDAPNPRCVAFLSRATNIARSDTNGVTDAFLVRGLRGRPKRIPMPGNRQGTQDVTQVAVSGNCSRVAFVSGGRLYVRRKGKTRRVRVPGPAADPSFSTGRRHDLVFGARRGIYLMKRSAGRPRRIVRGGSNPAFNDVKRRVVAFERRRGSHIQIGYKDLGRGERIISKRKNRVGNGDSTNPVIGNSGYYVTFESEATNLGVNSLKRADDSNGNTDVYLYTNVRDLTLVQSVEEKAVPLEGGGFNPSMSFYANYIVFDSPAPLGSNRGEHQVWMRYLGSV